jgi:hypothetical protein
MNSTDAGIGCGHYSCCFLVACFSDDSVFGTQTAQSSSQGYKLHYSITTAPRVRLASAAQSLESLNYCPKAVMRRATSVAITASS